MEQSVIISKNECLYKEVCLLKVRSDWPAGWRRREGWLAEVIILCHS